MDSTFLDLASRIQDAICELGSALESIEEAREVAHGAALNDDLGVLETRVKATINELKAIIPASVQTVIDSDLAREDEMDGMAGRASC